MTAILRIVSLVCLLGVAAGCPHYNYGLPPSVRMPPMRAQAPAKGIYHVTDRDETLAGVAGAYAADLQHLAEVNNLQPPYIVKAGTRLFIPGAVEPRPIRKEPSLPSAATRVEDFTGILAWPVRGNVTSHFGVRDGTQHNGISIEAGEGTPVRAAADGKVGYVGKIAGYGNVVLIEHSNRLVTVYAHLQNIKVEPDHSVKRSDALAEVGSSGRTQGPALYFEVRSRTKPRNPLFFLDRGA